jgi:hypothetical protein
LREAAKRRNSAAHLWPLLGQSGGKAPIANSSKNLLDDHHHRHVTFASKKRLVHTDVYRKKDGAKSVRCALLRELFGCHASVPWVEEFVVRRVYWRRFIALRRSTTSHKKQQWYDALHRPNEN